MQIKKTRNRLKYVLGIVVGVLNGFFGSGGGMIAVPVLRGLSLDDEKAHATSISIILPLALLSGFLYHRAEAFRFSEAWPYIPGGILGAIFGAWLLPRLKAVWLRRVFGAIILFSAGRLLFR